MAGARIQLKRATAASWASNNPVLYAGEIGLETDTNKFKIGDGTTAFNSLPYFNGNLTGSSLNDLADVTITSASNGDFLRWNGTAWINDAVNLSTDTVGNYMVDVAGGTGVTITHTPGEGSTASVAIGQDVATSASVEFAALTVNGEIEVAGHILPSTNEVYDLGSSSKRFRDIYLSGTSINLGGAEITSDGTTITFPGGLTGDLAGNADTASELETARTISLSGDLSGSASFDGSTDITISATVQPNSVALGTDTTGNYLVDVVAGTGVTVSHTPGEGSSASIAIGQSVATTASVTFAHVSADVTGDVTGNADTATTLQTARAISLAGDLSGSVSFDGSQNVTITAQVEPNSVALGTDTTGNFMSDVVAGTGVSISHTPGEGSSASIAIGQAVGTTDNPSFAGLTADGVQIGISGTTEIDTTSGNLTIDSAGGTVTLDDDVIITGNLTVSGSATYVNTETLTVDDNIIVLNSNQTGAPSQNAGIEVERGSSDNVAIQWNEATDSWELTEDGTTYKNIAVGQDVETSSSVTFAAVTAPLIGNASTASTLETARAISLSGDISGSASFDGSANITITADVQPNSVALGTDTTGNYLVDVVADSSGITVNHTAGEGSSASLSLVQDINTSASVTFANVTADLIGDVTGNADTATTLATARAISLAGDLSGSASFDGSQNITITADVQPNSVALGTDTTGNYVNDVVSGTGVTVTHTPGEGSSASIAIGQDVATTASVTFAHVSADVTGDLTGNADTATTLQTARAISLAGDLSGSVSFDGSQNVTITASVEPNSVALGVDTTGNYVNDVVSGIGVTVSHTPGEGSSASIAIGQDVATTASVTFAHVLADVTGDLSGNADTATTLETARTISLAGDLSGSVSFDGSQNVTITATVQPNSVALGTDTTGNFVSDVVAGTGISVTHTPGEASSASITLNAGLNELGDVVIVGSPERFQTLGYDGAGWVNSYAPVVSYVRNAEATTLTVGTVVYLFGGNGDHASVKRASNTSDTTSSKTVGVVGTAIAASENGPVVTRGYASGMDLSAYSVGDVLWLGTNGQFTTTKPSAPDHLVFIGVVVRATNNGIIYVATQNGYELEELHDVKVSSLTNGDFLKYVSASGVWVNDQINLGTDTVGDYVQNLVAGTGVTLSNNSGEGSTPTVTIGQDVATSASVVFHSVETTHDLTVGGNLYVSGSVVTENQTSLQIDDPFIYLNGSSSVSNVDLGIAGNYNDGTYRHAGIFRDATDGKFKFFDSYTPEPSNPIDVGHASYSPAPVVAETFESTITTGTAPFTVASTTEVVNLHADTASSLHTARAISLSGDLSGSVSFDGSGDVVLTASVEPNSVALGTDTTGNYMVGLAEGTGVTIVHTPGEGSTASVSIGQSVATTASVTFAHVSAALTGNVVGNITGDISGNSGTATALQNARTISLGGDLSGSASFNGTSDVTITATVEPNSVALGTDTTGNYVNDVTAGTGVTVTHTPGEGSSPTIAIGQNVATTASVTFAHVSAPVTGNVLGNLTGNVTGDVSGNAGTATALQNSRTIALGGDLSGSASFNGTSDVTITATVQPNSVALGTDTTGNFVGDVVAGAGITVTHTPGESSSASVALNANLDDLNDVSAAAPTDGHFLKYVSASSAWVPAAIPTINNLDDVGDVTITSAASGQFLKWNGSAWVNDAIDLGTDTTGNYMSDVVAGTGVTVTHTPGEGSSASIAIGQDVATSANVTFANITATGDLSVTSSGGDEGGEIKLAKPATNTSLAGQVSIDIYQNKIRFFENGGSARGAYIDLTSTTGSAGTNLLNAGAMALDDISNVTAPTPSTGDFLKWNGSAWVNDAIDLGTDTTGNYMSSVVAGTGVTVTHTPGEASSASIAIGQAVGTSDNPSFAGVTADGIQIGISASTEIDTTAGNLTIDSAGGTVTVDDNLVITGDLTVNGTTTTVNTETIYLADNIIILNANESGAPSQNAGIEVERGSSANVSIRWNETSDKWELTEDGSAYLDIATVSYVDAQTITQLDDIGDVSTASAAAGDFLKWNGSAWINDAINLGTDTVGNYVSDVTGGTGVTVTHTPGEGSSPSIAIGQSVATTASVTFAAVTAPLVGNASTATALATARSIALGGDLSGSASFDGSQNVTITAAVQPNSVELGTDTTGNYVADVVASTGISVSHTPGEGSSASISLNAALDDLTDTYVNNSQSGEVLLFNGQNWANSTLALDGLSDVNATSPTTGYFLKWDGSAWVPAEATIAPTTTTVSASAATNVYTFAKATYRTAEAIVQVTQGSKYTSMKVIIVHDGTNSYASQYGVIEIGTPAIPLTITTDISGNDVRLRATITDANLTNATVKVLPTLIAV